MKNNKNDTIKKRAYCPLCETPCAVKGDPKKGSLYYKPTAPTKAAINELQADIDALKLRIKQLGAEKAALKKKQSAQIAPLKWEVDGTGTYAVAHMGNLRFRITQIVGGLFRFGVNREHLVDAANLCLVEFAVHPEKPFSPVDDGEHTQLKQKDNI